MVCVHVDGNDVIAFSFLCSVAGYIFGHSPFDAANLQRIDCSYQDQRL